MKYENFEVTIRDVRFEVRKIDIRQVFENKKDSEVFLVKIYHKGKSMYYEFNNSIMEKEISDLIKQFNNQDITGLKQAISRRFMWGGYDKVNGFKGLEKERIYHLAYSIICDFGSYINFQEQNPTFKDFCLSFGYNEDSRKAEKIYNKCLELQNDIQNLDLSTEQENFFLEAYSESDNFTKELKEILGNDK